MKPVQKLIIKKQFKT